MSDNLTPSQPHRQIKATLTHRQFASDLFETEVCIKGMSVFCEAKTMNGSLRKARKVARRMDWIIVNPSEALSAPPVVRQ